MRRPILILLALLGLGLVAGVPFIAAAHRRAAQQDLAAMLVRHDAEGLGASFVDLAAGSPPVDPLRQVKARAWMKAGVPPQALGQGPWTLAWRIDGGEPDAKQREAHEAFRVSATEMRDLLAPGDLCLTSLGWLPPDPARATFSDRVGGFIPNLLGMRAVHRFFAMEACLAEDPSDALDCLDRLRVAMAAPGGLIDSMVTVACDAQRDEAYLTLALAGALPPGRRDTWLGEVPRGRPVVADGLRGERLRFAAPLAQELAAGGSAADHMGFEASSLDELWWGRVLPYFDGAQDCALCLEAMVLAERNVRGEVDDRTVQAAVDACAEVGTPFQMVLPNFMSIRVCGLACDEQHAAFRAAYVLMQAIRERGRAPVDDAEAHAWVRSTWPALSTDAWRYELVGGEYIHVAGVSAGPASKSGRGDVAFRIAGNGVEIRLR